MAFSRLIEWHSPDNPPVDDRPILIVSSGNVWFGFYRTGAWFSIENGGNPEPLENVTFWANKPEPPKTLAEKTTAIIFR